MMPAWASTVLSPRASLHKGDVVCFCVYMKLADGSIVYGKQVQYSPTAYAYNQLKEGQKTLLL